jgi:hypothetical protein
MTTTRSARLISMPPSIDLDPLHVATFFHFLQLMANRRVQGAIRYGDKPKKKQKYMTRMEKELRAYKQSGNMEQLLNIAVYCWLESEAPQNSKFYFDPSIDSVTR